MKVYESDTIQTAYRTLINDLLKAETVNGTKEIQNCCLCIKNPSIDHYWLPYRQVSEEYLKAELKWYWSGDNSVETIGKSAKMWYKLTDDGKTNNSAYGYILFKKYHYDQVKQIIELLKKDPSSRRAILNISDPELNKIETKDLQCTIAIQFLIRNDRLEETVYMRSNDVYYGLPYDYYFFVSIGQYIAEQLGMYLEQYIHHATSIHLYERDIEKFKSEILPKDICINVKDIIKETYEGDNNEK